MYCSKCKNFMDISNNLLIINNHENNIDSSDYDVSSDKNDLLTKKDITDILNNKEKNIFSKIQNINDIKNNMFFENIDEKDQNTIINKYFEYINKNNTSNIKNAYMYCSNCGFSEIIKNDTLIFNKNTKITENDFAPKNYINYKYDYTLPTTKRYNCINNNCETHKNPSIKDAVFFRLEQSYEIKYICSVCNSFWKNS